MALVFTESLQDQFNYAGALVTLFLNCCEGGRPPSAVSDGRPFSAKLSSVNM